MSNAPAICAVVLAAGQSRRMGPGVQKLLLPFAGSTVVGHVVDQLLAAGIVSVVVVVGQDPSVAATLAPRPVSVVRNDDPDADMLGSARCGLRALPGGCEAVMLVLGDQPAITPELVTKIVSAYATGGRGIVAPVYHGRRGHPMVFAAPYAREVLCRYDGVGVCGLLRSHAEDVFELHVDDDRATSDVDLPEDYQRELKRCGAKAAKA